MKKPTLLFLLSFVCLIGCSASPAKIGVKQDQLSPCPDKPNCVSSQASDKEHVISPIYFTGTANDAQNRLLQILENLPRTKVVTLQENYIRAESTSKVFRFVDDLEFYFQPTSTEQTIIHVRSASRIGYSDFGVNRQRIERIRNKFKVADN